MSQPNLIEVAAGAQQSPPPRFIVYIEVLRSGVTLQQRAVLDPKKLTIGRGTGCDIQIDAQEREVSSIHAELIRGDNGYTLRDPGSRNGIYIHSTAEPTQLVELPIDSRDDGVEVSLGPGGPLCRVRVGEVIPFDDYLVTGRLGEGGMATVFVAQEASGLSRLVVLKLIAPALFACLNPDEAKAMLQEEARIASQISHPNVVNIYRAGCYEGTHYISMEYLRGLDLNSILRQLVLRRRRCPPTLAAALMSQALMGLHAAHEARDASGYSLKIVHRDFTPSNIVCSPEGDVKLIDFGVARAIGRRVRSGSGQFVGKLSYASPEQIFQPKTIDRRSDIFAAGIVLHELCAGAPLFLREDEPSTIEAVRSAPIPAIAGVPAMLSGIISSALSRSPDERPATAEQLAEALDRFVLSEGGYHLQRKHIVHSLQQLGIVLQAPPPQSLSRRPTLFPKPRPERSAPKSEQLAVSFMPSTISVAGVGYRTHTCLHIPDTDGAFPHGIYEVLPLGPRAARSSEAPPRLHLIGKDGHWSPLAPAEQQRLGEHLSQWRVAGGQSCPLGEILGTGPAWPDGPTGIILPSVNQPVRWTELLAGKSTLAERRALAALLVQALADLARTMPGVAHGEVCPQRVFLINDATGARRLRLQLPSRLDHWIAASERGPAVAAVHAPYCAPERLNGAAPTPSGDVFSAAAMIFELLGGDVAALRSAAAQRGRDLALPTDVSAELGDVLSHALSPDPALRPLPESFLRLITPTVSTMEETLDRELGVPTPGQPLVLRQAGGRSLYVHALELQPHTGSGPLPLPFPADRVLPAPLVVSLFRDRLAIETADEEKPERGRMRLYPSPTSTGSARLFLSADSGSFEFGCRSLARLQGFDYRSSEGDAVDALDLPSPALRLRLPRPSQAALVWSREVQSGDVHVCCIRINR